jgi:ribulose-phosphate 3-epimerase
VIEDLDMVLVMTVNPGFGGQRFIPYTRRKIAEARSLLDQRNPACELEIDGGVDLTTIGAAYQAGARVFVAGTSVFGATEGAEAAVDNLMQAATSPHRGTAAGS